MITWIIGVAAALAVTALAAAFWFDALFEEPSARRVPSLIEHCESGSALAVFAHPDDETFAASALADAANRDGVWVRTITLTRGENGYPEPHTCRQADLPLVRESELRRFGFVLGIDHQEVWQYPDGSLSGVPADEILGRLVKLIREWKPDLVLTFDPEWGYTDHPDHRTTGRLTTDAVRLAMDPQHWPDLGPPHRPTKLAYVLAPRHAFARFGMAGAMGQPEATVATPVRRGLRAAGWRIHESQHLGRAYPFPAWVLDDFWDKEHYRVVDPGTGRPD